ncbi:TPA: ribbon-helix-helix protein, CopG family [Streptococcus suis]
MKINDVQINIRLSAKELERIKKAAEKAGISLSDYVRKALEDSSALRQENRELKKKLKLQEDLSQTTEILLNNTLELGQKIVKLVEMVENNIEKKP